MIVTVAVVGKDIVERLLARKMIGFVVGVVVAGTDWD